MKVAYITPFVALAAAACVRKPDVGMWDVKTGEMHPKKRKLCHPASPPPQFWDGLSMIPLTPNALQELN